MRGTGSLHVHGQLCTNLMTARRGFACAVPVASKLDGIAISNA